MAAPFTPLAFAPGLLARLPRPGAWMDALRKVLAFPMYATAAWLVWVLSLQRRPDQAWPSCSPPWCSPPSPPGSIGLAQRARASPAARPGQASPPPASSPAWPLAARPVAAPRRTRRPSPIRRRRSPACAPPASRCSSTSPPPGASPARSTSGWPCRAAPSPPPSAATASTYLVGDWTKPRRRHRPRALAEHGRAGVPLYLMYGAGGREPEVLPQLLTEGIVVRAADRAAAAS